jgi:glutathione synthase/RimK-type ligase-like ATP-grasp enzyme
LLAARGLIGTTAAQGVVSYGCRLTPGGTPALNANAGGGDKLAELQTLQRAGISVPWLCTNNQWRSAQEHLPVLGRRRMHRGGTDIRLIRTMAGLERWKSERDFFTKYLASDREFRVWVFRNAHLGTYEKVLRHPELRNRMVGRNYHNGYAFELVETGRVPRNAVELAKQAVRSLNLDFGAVDILQGSNGLFYVLEVNTAPGVEGPARQAIISLADHIAAWAKNGYRPRKELRAEQS